MHRLFSAMFVIALLTGCASADRSTQLANAGYESMRSGDYTKAEEHLTAALQADSTNPYALLNMGAVYQNTGRPVQARTMYQRLIDLNPAIVVGQTTDGKGGTPIVELARQNIGNLPK